MYVGLLMLEKTNFFLGKKQDDFRYYIKTICTIIFVSKTLIDLLRGKRLPFFAIIALIVALQVYKSTKDSSLIMLFFIISSVRNCDIKEMIKITLIVYSTIFAITISLSLLKVIPDWTYKRGNGVRHSLGFFYSTIASGFYTSVILMYFYIRNSKATWIELIILQGINYFIYSYTDGRLGYALVTLMLIILAAYKFISKNDKMKNKLKEIMNSKTIKWLCCAIPLIMLVGTLLLVYLYGTGNKAALYIDNLLSRRLELSFSAFYRYPITTFGTSIKWNGWGGYGYLVEELEYYDYNFVDSSYVRILFDFGTIMSAIILVAYTLLIEKTFKIKDYWLLLAIIITLISAFVEPYITTIQHNIFLIAISLVLNINKKEEKSKGKRLKE